MTSPLVIDGSYGEGGGQIIRTSLALSAITGRPIRLKKIRAGRRKPGLAAQHLTGVRAAASLCAARLKGDALGSQKLSFTPEVPPQAGAYHCDVADQSRGGSAGATSLVLQTVFLPLALADGPSRVSIRGGTHVAWSPTFDYLRDIWLPALESMGVQTSLELARWGWYPVGQGEIQAHIDGLAGGRLKPLRLDERGALRRIVGRAVASRLPEHIPRRMSEQASQLLADGGLASHIEQRDVRAACPGTGLFLSARYAHARAGFSSLGHRGKRAEDVGADAASAILDHHETGAAVDEHLADQLILPACLAEGESTFTTRRVTAHMTTNAWTVELFGIAEVSIEENADGTALVRVTPKSWARLLASSLADVR